MIDRVVIKAGSKFIEEARGDHWMKERWKTRRRYGLSSLKYSGVSEKMNIFSFKYFY